MPEIEKPPIGVAPYYMRATERIQELGEAIGRYALYANTTSQRAKIREWATEVMMQVEIIEAFEQGITLKPMTDEELERMMNTLRKMKAEVKI